MPALGRCVCLVAAAITAALLAGHAVADARSHPAARAVRVTLEAAEDAVAGEGTRNEKLIALRAIARTLFDTEAMGRVALGDVLTEQPIESRQAFYALYDEFVVRAYLQKLLFFRNPRFGFAPTEERGDDVLVRTRIRTDKDDYFVDYVLAERDGRWLATDIMVEGVSLSRNHGEQFRSLLRHESFDELLERMRRKVDRQRQREAAS